MLRASVFLLLTLAVVVMSTPLPEKHHRDARAPGHIGLPPKNKREAPLERRGVPPKKNHKRDLSLDLGVGVSVEKWVPNPIPVEKRRVLPTDYKREAPLEKRSPLEKRVFHYTHNAKRDALRKREFNRRSLVSAQQPVFTYQVQSQPTSYQVQTQPASYQIQTQPTSYQVQTQTTYYQLPDGRIVDAATLLALQGQVQYQPQYQTQYQPAPSKPTSTSSGGLLGILAKPFNAAGDIVKAVGDTAQNIIALPFNIADTAIQGVGLGDTGVGKLATGVLDVGEGLLQAKTQLESQVLQAPFRLVGNLLEG